MLTLMTTVYHERTTNQNFCDCNKELKKILPSVARLMP